MHTLTVGHRIAVLLRQRHPRHTVKEVARELGCDPRTVKSWLTGQMPANQHFLEMVVRYGVGFALDALEPLVGRQSPDELEFRLEQVNEQIAALREDLRRQREDKTGEAPDEPLAVRRRICQPQSRQASPSNSRSAA